MEVKDINLCALSKLLKEVKPFIIKDSDFTWTSYDSAQELIEEIDKHIETLEEGSVPTLKGIEVLFIPTGPLQEHSLSNNWSKEFMELAEECDRIIEILRQRNS